MYTEQKVSSLDDLKRLFDGQNFREWVYRGQADSTWELKTSLFRTFERISKLNKDESGNDVKKLRNSHESLSIEGFQNAAHLYLQNLPENDDKNEWISIMQHHGAPTRALDVTYSPYVALFFALNEGNADSAVYCFNCSYYSKLTEKFINEYPMEYKKELFEGNRRNDDSFFIIYESRMLNLRQKIQKGLFLIPSNNYETFETVLDTYAANPKKSVKLVIPKSLRLAGLKMLLKMNITEDILFPGIEGLCRSLGNQMLIKNTLLTRREI